MYDTGKPLAPARGRLLALASLALATIFLAGHHLPPRARWALPRPRPRRAPAFPPPLSRAYAPAGAFRAFTVPRLLSYYEDVLPSGGARLYLVTSGIMMRVSQRGLSAVACLVGRDVFPAVLFRTEVLHCVLPRRLRPAERLAPVLAWDDKLRRAAAAPVTLATGVVAELAPGDIAPLPPAAVLRGNLTGRDRADFRLARSDVTVRAETDALVPDRAKFAPRYRLCLMTMVAPNSHMLRDWADYHRRIGVDHVYIFDNGAQRDLRDVFARRPDVEILSWPYHKSQVQCVTTFLFAARARCERVMLEDSDEYPMLGLGNGTSLTTGERPLIRYARYAESRGFLHYKLLHVVMVNSGFLRRPPRGEVPTNFIHRRAQQLFRNGKSVCYTDQPWEAGAVHHCGEVDGKKPPIMQLDIHQWGALNMRPEQPADPPFLMHFRDRSWEEYIEKWDAGRVAGKLVNDERAGVMSLDHPDKGYMAVRPELEYTHFRDKIYKRVLAEGSLDEQTTVQIVGDRRCEKVYKIRGNGERVLEREACIPL